MSIFIIFPEYPASIPSFIMLLSFILTVDYEGLGTPSNRKVHCFTDSFFFKLGVTGSVYADRVHRAPTGAFPFSCCTKIFSACSE